VTGGRSRQDLVPRYALIAVVAAVATIALKGAAYFTTGSIAILSDAMESIVNVVTSAAAYVLVSIAARPADEEHAYGHTKVEYFASGFEGAMILAAAATIGYAALRRLVDPVPLVGIPEGFAFVSAATLLNFLTARLLMRGGRRHRSIALEAGGQHLMVDVWTSLAVLGGLGAARLTGWVWLDPLIALGVAINILRIGYDLVRRSMLGLLDTALPEELRAEIARILEQHRPDGVQYHAIRTRQAGSWRFISFHILVPGDWTVQRGHDLLEEIEEKVRSAIPDSTVFTHLEPIEDPLSWQDTGLRR
jgi:cation diffusion facilitator family transporter